MATAVQRSIRLLLQSPAVQKSLKHCPVQTSAYRPAKQHGGYYMQMSTTSSGGKTLENRVALVTGSTSGIGLGIAQTLASRGCSVILNGFGEESTINKLLTDIERDYQGRADYVFADLSQVEGVDKMCSDIKTIHPGGVDIIVNNAGFQHVSRVEDFSIETWQAMVAVMLTAPFLLIKHFVPDMKQKGWGRIVNVSSAHGHIGSPNKAGYVSCKHGIIGLTKVLGLELGGTGVTCNALCPGYVNTPILQGQVEALSRSENLSYPEAEANFLANFHATKSAVGIDHLGEAVAFMCSDAASQMTGTSLIMDGGWTAK